MLTGECHHSKLKYRLSCLLSGGGGRITSCCCCLRGRRGFRSLWRCRSDSYGRICRRGRACRRRGGCRGWLSGGGLDRGRFRLLGARLQVRVEELHFCDFLGAKKSFHSHANENWTRSNLKKFNSNFSSSFKFKPLFSPMILCEDHAHSWKYRVSWKLDSKKKAKKITSFSEFWDTAV